MRSFKDARAAFATNLRKITEELHYTPTTLALKLSGLSSSGRSVATGQNVNDWVSGTSIPNVYQLFKLGQLLNVKIDDLINPSFNIDTFSGRSFATPKKKDEFEEVCTKVLKPSIKINKPVTTPNKGTITMASTNTITISKTLNKAMLETVRERTDSTHANRVLAHRIYSSDYQLKDIAATVGCSTRSLRDYAFYGVSMTEEIATSLRSFFNTTYHNLGLYLNRETGRYEALKVKVKQ